VSEFETPGGHRERALDRALGQTFRPPRPSPDFRRHLAAACARAGEMDLSQLRLRLEAERRATLTKLEAHYVRLRRRTLGTLIGAAFGAGAAVTLTLPWLQRQVGTEAPLVLTSAGAAAGLAIAFLSWHAHTRGDSV
jgi:hypothetical protein